MDNITLARELMNFQSDFLFFQREVPTLRKRYLNQFIAIKNNSVVGSASSIEELRNGLEKKGLDISTLVVEFVSEEENFMVL